VDAALRSGGRGVERVVVWKRSETPVEMSSPRDISWTEFLAGSAGSSGDWWRFEANETGLHPRHLRHDRQAKSLPSIRHGGYQVHIFSMGRWCFGLKPTDVWWSTSDIGWIVGHSYIVYAPLLTGCTTVVFEGALDFPQAKPTWRTVVEELGVTGIFTSPTAVRMLMRYGDAAISERRLRPSRGVCSAPGRC